MVVKVRLLAVRPSRSSRKRSRSVSAVVSQGKCARSASSWLSGAGSSGRYDAIAHAASEALPVPPAVEATRWIAVGSVLGLIVLGLAWELWLPAQAQRCGWLKVLPLCIPVAGLLQRRMYTYRWVSLLVWLYFMEGVVRASERPARRAGDRPVPRPVRRLRDARAAAPAQCQA